jgi:hypothetical protein
VRFVMPILMASIFGASVSLTLAQPAPLSVALFAIVMIAATVGAYLPPMAAAVLGLATAGVDVALMRAVGAWAPGVFQPVVAASLLTIAMPFLAALVGQRLQTAARAAREARADAPLAGSLGLIEAETGEALLGDEILRAEYTRTPLTLMRMLVQARPTGTIAHRLQSERAAVRVLEATLHVIHIPYAYGNNDLVAILPGTTAADARSLADRIVRDVRAATIRSDGRERELLTDYATVAIGLAEFPADGASIGALVDAAHPDHASTVIRSRDGELDPARKPRGTDPTAAERPAANPDLGGRWVPVGPGRPEERARSERAATRAG